jgi:hypothetical protein
MTERGRVIVADIDTDEDIAAASGEDPPAGHERRARFRAALGTIATSSSGDLIRWMMIPASIAVVVGFNLMLFGWIGASRTAREIEQIPYLISGGLAGLGLVILGGLLLASAFWATITGRLADEASQRDQARIAALEARIEELSAAQPPAPSPRKRTGARAGTQRAKAS